MEASEQPSEVEVTILEFTKKVKI